MQQNFIGSEDEDTISNSTYKEVVVLGNGPSAITISYMLSGHWPYYTGNGHSLNFLHHRLMENEGCSLVHQDLVDLCDGLEGRSNNPVSVLFDRLNHPDADLGISNPSLMDWRFERDKALNHVVLGNGNPGGSWQSMEGSTLTVSLGSWMELPNMPFKEWELQRERSNSCGLKVNRVPVRHVAHYYKDYVRLQGLDSYFRNFSQVTCVRRIPKSGNSPQDQQSYSDDGDDGGLWKVEGIQRTENGPTPFQYVTPHVVLATGSFDCPNILDIPGEDLPFVIHSLSTLEILIKQKKISHSSDPVMIVGAGLSAADAIITAHFFGVQIVHVFRRNIQDPNLIFNKLPENMYPEYHKVYQMMHGKGVGYQGYQPYPCHQVVGITPDKKVRIQGPDSSTVFQVSYLIVMVGSSPDLSYLPQFGQHLCVDPVRPINCRDNPFKVNVFSQESVAEPGLFAMGPLVGDNFVRFVQGGALAITNHLVKKKEERGGEFTRFPVAVCGEDEGNSKTTDGCTNKRWD